MPRAERSDRTRNCCLDELDDLPTTDRLKGERISYLKFFTIDPTLKLTTNCAHVMVNLLGRRFTWRPSPTDIYSGLTASTRRGYDNVSKSSLNDPTRIKTDSGVFYLWWLFAGAGLIDGQASSTCMFSRAAVESLIFASFAVYSMFYSSLARLN